METGFAHTSHLKYYEERDYAEVVCITIEGEREQPESREAQLTVSVVQTWDGVWNHSYSYHRVSTAGHRLVKDCSIGHLIAILHLRLFYHRTEMFWALWTSKSMKIAHF